MSRLFTVLVAVCALGAAAPSQSLQTHEPCGHAACMQHAHAQDPGLAARRAAIEAHTQSVIGGGRNVLPDTIRIPVVFHVVYANAQENLPTSRLLQQLDVLNEDFNRLNGDLSSIVSQFSGLVGDANMRFELATRDPQGNPTTGVTRTSTTVTNFGSGANSTLVTSTATGGRDPWPASDYLNVWVCALTGNTNGYAWYPGASTGDGIVCDYTTIGNAATSPNLGRTCTHEVGHWLNLVHVWGDSTNCSIDDLVADTPPCDGPAYCALNRTSCGGLDMANNYMNYGTLCRVAFTDGQVQRMRALFEVGGFRESLRNSPALDPDYQVNQSPNVLARVRVGGAIAPAATPTSSSVASMMPGQNGTIDLFSFTGPTPWDLAVTFGPTRPATPNGFVTPGGQVINVDLLNPTLFFFNSLGPAPALLPFPGTQFIPFQAAPAGVTFSLQMIKLDPGGADPFFLSQAVEVVSRNAPCITVEASGSNSFNSITSSGFWKVIHRGGCAPIQEVEIDASTLPFWLVAAFDTDQTGLASRFDGGNSTLAGCEGTYRLNSDVTCGLVYDAQNTPSCDPAANSGFIGTQIDSFWTGANYDNIRFRFAGGQFTNRTFQFDADTDGAGVDAGGDMAGMTIRITLTNGQVLVGSLARSSTTRSFVDFL